MSDWLPALISSVITALIVSGGGWLLIRAQNKKLVAETVRTEAEAIKAEAESQKLAAETADQYMTTSLRLVASLDKRVTEAEAENELNKVRIRGLETEVAGLKLQIRDITGKQALIINERSILEQGVRVLTAQLKALGLTPDWSLPDE